MDATLDVEVDATAASAAKNVPKQPTIKQNQQTVGVNENVPVFRMVLAFFVDDRSLCIVLVRSIKFMLDVDWVQFG